MGILHMIIKVWSGQVQCWESEGWVPAEQLGHQGQAGVLLSLGPAGNWLQARNGLSSGSGSCFPDFTFTEPVLELIIPKCFLGKTRNKIYSAIF